MTHVLPNVGFRFSCIIPAQGRYPANEPMEWYIPETSDDLKNYLSLAIGATSVLLREIRIPCEANNLQLG